MSTEAVTQFFTSYDHDFWGDMATWVGSIGSILAFCTAAIVFWFDRRSNKRNFSQVDTQLAMAIEQLDIQKFQIESEQASKVGVWLELQKLDEQSEFYGQHERDLVSRWKLLSSRMRAGAAPGSESFVADYKAMRSTFGEAGPSRACWVVAVVHNNSDLPVYALNVMVNGTVRGKSINAQVLSLPILAPTGGRTVFKISDSDGPLILPDTEEQTFLAQARPLVTFRDNSGTGWKRDGGGKLTKASP